MAEFDTFSEEEKQSVAAQIGERLPSLRAAESRFAPELLVPLTTPPVFQTGGNPHLAESFKIVTLTEETFLLTAAEAQAVSSLKPYLQDSGRWHHQIRGPGQGASQETIAFAQSRNSTPQENAIINANVVVTQVTSSPLAVRLDDALTYLDQIEQTAPATIPSDAVVRLLLVPSRRITAFYISLDGPTPIKSTTFERLLVVAAPFQLDTVDFFLIEPGVFLTRMLTDSKPVTFPPRPQIAFAST